MAIHLGIGGLAAALTLLLWFGTTPGGRVGPLSWGWTLFLAVLAGCSFKAAGPPFSWISDLINEGLAAIGESLPKMTAAGMAVCLVVLLCFKKLTLRQLAMTGTAFFLVASGAGGPFQQVAAFIERFAQHWA
ncbi:hypothetical protein ACFY0A_37800 [Streptomyces sp. NPDC001698]|uniref:hypothetical protein n=1 Tax=Streptomyces sp. NPDC001698 TaxID=3364601 RepID=UPI003692EE41